MRASFAGPLLGAVLLAACGSDDPSGPHDGLPLEEVAGRYDLTLLTFDVRGELIEVRDILARLDPDDPAELTLSLDGAFQLRYYNPVRARTHFVEGTFETLAAGIQLRFPDEPEARTLLLPRRAELDFEPSGGGTLSFSGEVAVPLHRLRELEPDFEEVPLADPVPGRLEVVFTARTGGG